MEKLAGLQHLVNAPKLSVANKIINLVFERRSTGFSDEEEAQISSILGGLSPEDTQSLLVAIRLLIKISLRKNIELTQIPQAFPDSVDKRLHPIILKILAAHIDTWRQEIAQDKAAAAAAVAPPAPQKEESSLPPPPPPSQPQEPSKDETESEKVNEEEEKEKEREAKRISELKKRKKEKEEEEEKEREREREKEKLRREKELQKQKQQQEEQEEEERRRKAAEEEAIRAKKKKRAAALAQQQQQQQQQLKGLSGPSLPRLQGFDWRIDVRSASESVSNMIVPSVIVQMEVEKQKMGVSAGSNSDDGNNNKVVTFELNRETLETMLDGLIFVRDQLASIAAK